MVKDYYEVQRNKVLRRAPKEREELIQLFSEPPKRVRVPRRQSGPSKVYHRRIDARVQSLIVLCRYGTL